MSLILEALKKSEAERRLGRAPDLLTPASTAQSDRRPWLWLWGVVFGLAAALVLVLALWVRSALFAPAAPAPTAMPSAPAPSAAPPPAALPETPARTTPAPAPAQRPQRTSADAIANAPLPRDPMFSGVERESMPVAAHTIPLPPESLPTDTPKAAGPTAAPAPSTRRSATPVANDSPSSPATLTASAIPPAPTPAPAPEVQLEAIPHLATLPAAQREGLPPLRLTMHVFDPDPAARFVLIDGKRYRQGDSLAEGLVIDAIRPDGVAIARDGQRFLVSRP
ncbi:general secretion pathway protein GspB [Xanthomonadaceae bacterium JHOS43]|nr:general secretion pathway protein GspB [Xanthomonadaceae bacterium JHOS43]